MRNAPDSARGRHFPPLKSLLSLNLTVWKTRPVSEGLRAETAPASNDCTRDLWTLIRHLFDASWNKSEKAAQRLQFLKGETEFYCCKAKYKMKEIKCKLSPRMWSETLSVRRLWTSVLWCRSELLLEGPLNIDFRRSLLTLEALAVLFLLHIDCLDGFVRNSFILGSAKSKACKAAGTQW